MAVEIKMPQMGESLTEGTLVKWRVKPGERVERDDILFEIETDKVTAEVPAPASGYLAEVFVEEGRTVPVDTPVCRLTEETPAPGERESRGAADSVVPSPAARETEPAHGGHALPEAAAPADRAVSPAEPPEPARREHLSPAVRRLVRDHSVELSHIEGTGAEGRVTRNDVLRHLQERDGRSSRITAATPTLVDRVEPLSLMRKQIAEHMVQSKRVSPHASTIHEADMHGVHLLREELRSRWHGISVRPTYMPFAIQAIAYAMREYPAINASLLGNEVHYKGEINIGVAVSLDEGLIVPVIRNADSLSILELTRVVEDLATRARNRKLQPEEVQGGTFTITNPGVFGSLIGSPILHQPQVAILCFGTVQKRPVVLPETDAIAVRRMAYLTLTFDHRLIDGALAARFMHQVTKNLEAAEFFVEA